MRATSMQSLAIVMIIIILSVCMYVCLLVCNAIIVTKRLKSESRGFHLKLAKCLNFYAA